MMTRPLSPREREVYNVIVAAAEAGKPCPTNTQIMDATGIRLTQSINDYLNRIVAKG
ncbi:MAG: hypothetical protein U5M50_04035 [Sphingobium sp.]|nr:hypothetical protein [Sphingobium sp.]